jgi:hypothetical protein
MVIMKTKKDVLMTHCRHKKQNEQLNAIWKLLEKLQIGYLKKKGILILKPLQRLLEPEIE